MTKQFIKVTEQNALELYENGYMNKGCLVKYRFCEDTMDLHWLNREENDWVVGIIYEIFIVSFTHKSKLRVTINEQGWEEVPVPLYDLFVYTNDPTIPKERINHISHEVFLAKV